MIAKWETRLFWYSPINKICPMVSWPNTVCLLFCIASSYMFLSCIWCFLFFSFCSNETARDTRKAWVDPNSRPKLVCSTVVRNIGWRAMWGSNMAYIESQIMRISVALLIIVYTLYVSCNKQKTNEMIYIYVCYTYRNVTIGGIDSKSPECLESSEYWKCLFLSGFHLVHLVFFYIYIEIKYRIFFV